MRPSLSQTSVVTLSLSKERERFNEQRRTVYLIVGGIGLLLLCYDLYHQFSSSTSDRLVYTINDLVFAFSTLLLMYLGYRRHVKLEKLERAVFIFLAFQSFVFNSLAPYLFNFSPEVVVEETIGDDVWLLLLVCAMALHLFTSWRGVMIAASFYSLSMLVTGSYLLGETSWSDERFTLTAEVYLTGAMVLCFLYVLAQYRDNVQRLSSQYALLEKVAFLDALTGLPNRRHMYDAVQQQLELSARYGTPFCIALFDIDHFKRVNDHFGHLKGDEVLGQVANVLRNELRTSDLLGRWGGEEFLVLLPQTDAHEALTVAERCRQATEHFVLLPKQAVTISGGLTGYSLGDDVTSLVQRADVALYKAKERGRNKVVSSETAQPLFSGTQTNKH
jgi:diguanylate cyclase (GGDEF)-like protein